MVQSTGCFSVSAICSLKFSGQFVTDRLMYDFYTFCFVFCLFDYQVIWETSLSSIKDICTVCLIIIELSFTCLEDLRKDKAKFISSSQGLFLSLPIFSLKSS